MRINQKISAVILAAGESRRFGSTKQVTEINGKPMLQAVLDVAVRTGFYRILLVLGANSNEILKAMTIHNGIEVLINSRWKEGQSTSVRAGVEALKEDSDAIVFLLGDQPFISQALIQDEMMEYQQTDAEIVFPTFDGEQGNPVLFSKECYQDLMQLMGDRGGKSIIHTKRVHSFEWSRKEEWADIDTLEDKEKTVEERNAYRHLSTIILSAGLSKRMKKSKLTLPWGKSTVLGTVISAYQEAGINHVIVVTGGHRESVEREALQHNAIPVFQSFV